MSTTEPLRHVKVHGRHLFIPRSLTDVTTRCAPSDDDCDDREGSEGGCGHRRSARRSAQSEPPTAEERRVLHELLAAVVLSASCRCYGIEGLMDSNPSLSNSSGGVTNAFSRSTLSAVTAEGSDAEERQPLPTPSYKGGAKRRKHDADVAPPCGCASAQTVACAVAVVLLSCALLRTTHQ